MVKPRRDHQRDDLAVAVLPGVTESIIETKATTIREFIRGLRGSLSITFEEGTSAAWLYELLKPEVAEVQGLLPMYLLPSHLALYFTLEFFSVNSRWNSRWRFRTGPLWILLSEGTKRLRLCSPKM